MIFIMGFQKGKDELVYKQKIDLCVSELIIIMHWAESADCIGADFQSHPIKSRISRRLSQ